MKKYTPYLITFVIAILAIVLWPTIKPFIQKIPVVGSLV